MAARASDVQISLCVVCMWDNFSPCLCVFICHILPHPYIYVRRGLLAVALLPVDEEQGQHPQHAAEGDAERPTGHLTI